MLSQSILFTLIPWLLLIVTAHPLEQSDDAKLNTALSLPDLISLNKIPSNWIAADSTSLKEGRIVLTPKRGSKGSLWQKDSFKLENSFTLEWTFRSVNFVGKTEGGLAFWLLAAAKDNDKDKSFYNGPSKFDGLQLLVDNNGPLSSTVRAQLGDGNEPFTKNDVYDKTFASCLLGYQDSSVPSTIRLTYDRNDNHFLKLQVDNRVCFQTRKVQFPQGEYRIGVTAENSNTLESFEILKMRLYDDIIEDSLIPNVNAMGQPKMLTKIVDQDTGQEKLLEKELYDAQNEKITNYEIYKKLDKVEGKVLANDIHSLEVQLADISKTQEELLKYVAQLSQIIRSHGENGGVGGVVDKDNYKDFISMNEKLEKMLVEQEKIREAAKHSGQVGPHMDEIASKLAIWLFPLIVIMLIMAYYTFRIRQEIVKTKLL